MPNAANSGPETPSAPPKDALEAAFDAAEASERAPLGPGRAAAPPALLRPAPGLRQALTDPPASGSPPERRANLRNGFSEGAQDPAAAPPSVAPQSRGPEESPRLRAPRLSGRLAALAETAKAYARSAQADNTQRAYAGDWRQFASWLRRQGLAETPPDPEAVGLYLASQVERRGPSFRSRPSSGASPGSPGDTDNSASRSRSATAISQRCLPASAAATPALPSRRPRSSPMSFWPCWRRWRWT